MIRLRLSVVKFLLKLVLFLLPAFSFGIAGYLRFHLTLFPPVPGPRNLRAYIVLLIFTSIGWAIISQGYGLASPDKLFAGSRKTRRIASACAVTYLVAFVATFLYREEQFSRIFVVLSCVLLFFLTIISQIVFRVILEGLRRKGKYCIRALIIGADQFAVSMANRLMRGQITPCQIAGYVALSGQEPAVSNCPIIYLEDIPRLAINNGIDEAILALPPSQFSEIPAVLRKLDPLCVPIRAALDFGDGVKVSDQLFDLGGVPMLDLQPTLAESMSFVVMKRTFDIIFSTAIIALTFPLIVLIAVVIKLTSRGPVFFVQDRVGMKGQFFRMYKFRTMRVGPDQEANTRWTVKNDPRCTRMGALLRRTSLDELPQFFNVIKGDMSVVGPRPERPHFVEKFMTDLEKYNNRHYIKAGITGWAQVNGLRGDTSIAKRIEYDLYYLRNWSVGFDLQIILLTVLRGLHNKNAY